MNVESQTKAAAKFERQFWATSEHDLLGRLQTTAAGLTSDEAARRLITTGPNRVGAERHAGDRAILVRQFSNPIVLLLIGATVLSMFLGDEIDAAIIFSIVVTSAVLGFVQERGAVHAVRALLSSVRVHADALRDGKQVEVALEDVVPGDVVLLRAGDLVPGDCRLLTADALLVDESALTGESYPARKQPCDTGADEPIARRRN